MQDRLSLYPGRVKLTPVSGQENIYDMERADEPTQIGTALNKANLLKDGTAYLYGLDDSAVPNDLFRVIASTGGYIYVTTKTSDGSPVPGIPVMVDGEYIGKTSADGEGMFLLTYGSHTVTLVKPLDISSITPSSFDVDVYNAGAQKISAVCVLSTSTSATISKSGTYGFSDRVSDFDICVVGGGGSGGAAVRGQASDDSGTTAGGGGGGGVANLLNIDANKYNVFAAVIGAGAPGKTVSTTLSNASIYKESGSNGGSSSVKSLVTGIETTVVGGTGGEASSDTARGGNGGSGGGGAAGWNQLAAGGGGQDGADGADVGSSSYGFVYGGTGQGTTTRMFADSTKTALSPGGGGAASRNSSGSVASGSAQSGGSPGVASNTGNAIATKGTIAGSGGGAAVCIFAAGTATSADGADGAVLVQWRYK